MPKISKSLASSKTSQKINETVTPERDVTIEPYALQRTNRMETIYSTQKGQIWSKMFYVVRIHFWLCLVNNNTYIQEADQPDSQVANADDEASVFATTSRRWKLPKRRKKATASTTIAANTIAEECRLKIEKLKKKKQLIKRRSTSLKWPCMIFK
ncbi:unnamed protein product [Larinioides sclopetarius]|uniref:Uncharacterized protein n=1 Tax=Larinioides sclopetarius TaxID=280406 RepID=A0AAV2C172_9ARAC